VSKVSGIIKMPEEDGFDRIRNTFIPFSCNFSSNLVGTIFSVLYLIFTLFSLASGGGIRRQQGERGEQEDIRGSEATRPPLVLPLTCLVHFCIFYNLFNNTPRYPTFADNINGGIRDKKHRTTHS